MTRQEHEVAGIISKDANDDARRLFECAKKYETIVKQVDELLGIMNKGTSVHKPRKSRRGSASVAVSSSQPNNNDALVQTVTRFLHELRANPKDSECSRST
ncbi:hypothetical protein SESBI_31054 [Sesbania bispinosa]|nr:hypothetical protein SESBI_31054 [Sesbania bispinosa]